MTKIIIEIDLNDDDNAIDLGQIELCQVIADSLDIELNQVNNINDVVDDVVTYVLGNEYSFIQESIAHDKESGLSESDIIDKYNTNPYYQALRLSGANVEQNIIDITKRIPCQNKEKVIYHYDFFRSGSDSRVLWCHWVDNL